jgi:predicted nuclease of predicted toxin-antitoxin system
MLKFKIDENLPIEVAVLLIDAGYDAVTVPEQKLGGHPDPEISVVCRSESRAIVTLDLDFADIRVYPPEQYEGIVVFRLARLNKRAVVDAAGRLLPLLSDEPLTGKLWIVDETRVRIRS